VRNVRSRSSVKKRGIHEWLARCECGMRYECKKERWLARARATRTADNFSAKLLQRNYVSPKITGMRFTL